MNTPKLYMWISEMLYIGAFAVPYREHKVAQDKLIISLNGTLTLTQADGETVSSRTCLIQTGMQFNKKIVDTNNSVVAIYYLAPFSQDYYALRSIMTSVRKGVHAGHPSTEQLIRALISIREQPLSAEETITKLRELMIPPAIQQTIYHDFDSRILKVVQKIRSTFRENLTVKELALNVNLSESRLEKLVKSQLRLPITQYRLRYRVYISAVLLAQGYSVTQAAFTAGFSSTAHFSKSFSAINGIPPSTPFLKPPYIETIIGKEVTALVQSLNAGSSPTYGVQNYDQK